MIHKDLNLAAGHSKQNGALNLTLNGNEICIPYARQREILQMREHGSASWHIFRILSEFVDGFDFLEKYDRAVSFFGSARTGFNDQVYEKAEALAFDLSKMGFAIFTGGGPGIMEAANKGAHEAGGVSVGVNINLPSGYKTAERKNDYITDSIAFDFFFSRKVILSFASQIYIFFPGGFGTLDELFEMLTLVQTKKTSPVPIILVDKAYWLPLVSWIRERLYEANHAIDKEDLDLFHLVDTPDEALSMIRQCIGSENGMCK